METTDDVPENILIRERESTRHQFVHPSTNFAKAFRHLTFVIYDLVPKFVMVYNLKKRIMERIKWENGDTCNMQVLRISGQVICQHVFSLRCQKEEHCKRDGWSYMIQSFTKSKILGFEMYWPNVVEMVNEDNNEDKGYHSLNEERVFINIYLHKCYCYL
jgi:hypothetical protein